MSAPPRTLNAPPALPRPPVAAGGVTSAVQGLARLVAQVEKVAAGSTAARLVAQGRKLAAAHVEVWGPVPLSEQVRAARGGARSRGWQRPADTGHAQLVRDALDVPVLDPRGPVYLGALAGDRHRVDECRLLAAGGDELAAAIIEWVTLPPAVLPASLPALACPVRRHPAAAARIVSRRSRPLTGARCTHAPPGGVHAPGLASGDDYHPPITHTGRESP